jgi:hypothetical protein
MHFKPSFYRSAAVCSMLSAITTLLLIFLPRFFEPAQGFEGRMARVYDSAYQLRSWVYLLHPFLALMAAIAIAARIRVQASAAALIGLLGFVLWASTEAFQQTLTLFAFDKWRVMYTAADELTRNQIRTNASMYDGLWDAMYFLLLIGFAIGNLSLGQALARWRGLTRVVGCFLLLAFLLTLTNIFSELRWMQLSGLLAEWSYPAIQPLGRVLIGIWLWRVADETNSADLRYRSDVQ